MRVIVMALAVLMILASGCGSDSPSGVQNTTPTTYELSAGPGWFVTSPDVDLSKFSSVSIVVTFKSNAATDFTFSTSPQFQLWTHPDVYDLTQPGTVTINDEPSGQASPGSTFMYDLTVDLTNIPPNQVHIALRPTEDTTYGTLGTSKISVSSSEVKFTP